MRYLPYNETICNAAKADFKQKGQSALLHGSKAAFIPKYTQHQKGQDNQYAEYLSKKVFHIKRVLHDRPLPQELRQKLSFYTNIAATRFQVAAEKSIIKGS